MHEVRCYKCQKLLFKAAPVAGGRFNVEAKCPRCGKMARISVYMLGQRMKEEELD